MRNIHISERKNSLPRFTLPLFLHVAIAAIRVKLLGVTRYPIHFFALFSLQSFTTKSIRIHFESFSSCTIGYLSSRLGS